MSEARQTLDRLLDEAAWAGQSWPCRDHPDFISEDRAEREAVIPLCAGCPFLLACRAVVDETKPSAGVWAGVDFQMTVLPRAPRKTPRPSRAKNRNRSK